MAGNKSIFDAAMKRGQSYAFDNQWERALREYQRALAEFPDDHEARSDLAQAQFRFGQWGDALAEYQKLLAAQPHDPFIINRIAECCVNLGRTEAAEAAYAELADIYVEQGVPREAVGALRTMAQLNPRRRETHERLAALYRRMGETHAAVAEHLTLSRLALEEQPENLAAAVRHAEAAFNLDHEHRAAREWLYRLRQRQAEVEGLQFDEKTLEVIGSIPPGTSVSPRELNEMLVLAESYRDRGQNAAAMRQYEAVIRAGLRRADIFYNLGLIYQQLEQYEQAIDVLRLAGDDPEYSMSSYYALGMCYRQLGRLREATQAFENAVASVDLATVTRNELDDLCELYDAAAKANMVEGNQARAATLYSTVTQFLSARRWHTGRTAEFVRLAEQLTESSVSAKLRRIGGGEERQRPSDPLGTGMLRPANAVQPGPARRPSSDRLRPITDFLRASDEALARAAAAPAHGTMAAAQAGTQLETSVAHGGAPAAGGPPAWDILPDDSGSQPDPGGAAPRSKPGLGFAANGRSSAAVRIPTARPGDEVADAQVDGAFAESGRYLEQGLLDAALDSSLEVIRQAPDYLPIHLRLAEIYRRLGRNEDAVLKLQSVIDVYMVRGEPEMAAQVFPALIELNPDNANLRSKLATLLLDLGDTGAAVEEYMKLADTYFSAGQHDRALEELRRLRGLAPDNVGLRLRAGSYYLRLNRPQDALVEFGRALQMEPANNVALVRTYVALSLTGEPAQWEALQTVVQRALAGHGQTLLEELQSAARTFNRPELYLAVATVLQRLFESNPGDARDDAHVASMSEALDRGIAAMRGSVSPVGVQLRYRRANLALENRDSAGAVPLYSDVLEMLDDPELEAALSSAQRLVKLPEKVEVLQKLADAHALSGDAGQAIEALQAAKTYAPYDRAIYTKLAELYFRQGRLGAALVALDELITHYQDTMQTEKMLETLGYMARLAPNNITVRRKLADTLIKRGMIDQGLLELATLAELQTKNGMLKDAVVTYQRAADIYWTMGQHREAFAVYDRILRVAPSDVDARQYLINLYIATGRIREAVREQKHIAELLLQQKKTKEGVAALHQVIALAPSDAEAHYALAEILAEQHEFEQAARLYARLRRLEPQNDAQLAGLQAEMQRKAAQKATAIGHQG